ncbi:MAG: rhodanese-like domain-containing protein [Bacteroidales bacterium]|nr:rhodanese-like domain-containing protein [Bacteroidales bacterium]
MKKYQYIILSALLSILVSCGIDDSKQYVLSADETLIAYLSKEDVLSPEKLANLLLCKKDTHLYQFIDIRTPHEFAIKHLDGAINVPSKDILDDSNLNVLNQDQKINVIFCRSNCQAVNSYLMLKQLNYKNIKVALGGYDFIDKYIEDSYGIKTGVYNDEKPRYDFLRLITGTEEPLKDTIASPEYVKNKNRVIKDFDESCPDLN